MQNLQQTPNRSRRWLVEFVAGGIALIAFIAVLLIPGRQQPPPQQSVIATPGVTSTPLNFSDFSGRVISTKGSTVTVLFRGLSTTGTVIEKTYVVTVDQATELQSLALKDGKTSTAPITVTNLKPNDLVFVAGSGNLATVNAFTANKILLNQQ